MQHLLSPIRFAKNIGGIYTKYIRKRHEEPRFLILMSFLLTFVIVRLTVYSINGPTPPKYINNIYIHNIHIHHLVFGILFLLIAGFIRIPQFGPTLVRSSSILYGIGAALTLDEFALWLRINPNAYFGPQGRISLDAIVIFSLILLSSLWHGIFWKKLFSVVASVLFIKKWSHFNKG
ncbi:MAG TPA: hypothetical protein VFQ63_00625 [Patescibacteria group bacterium]|nr:hypothetical protein [Patescibacteria group bacterium]